MEYIDYTVKKQGLTQFVAMNVKLATKVKGNCCYRNKKGLT
jgi:hypothetical protein